MIQHKMIQLFLSCRNGTPKFPNTFSTNTLIKVFALHQSIQLTCGKISTHVQKHNSGTSHDLYCTYLRAISRITFTYSTALFKIILQTNHCMQDTNSQRLKASNFLLLSIPTKNCNNYSVTTHISTRLPIGY